MNKVVVEYDYVAKEPDELSIKKGDIITNVVKKEGGWWEGVLNDKKGMFPDNFVKSLDKDQVVLRNQKDVSRIRQCRVIFSYNQDHEDELNLKVGDIIDIIGEEEEGWWRGTLNGKEGVFPSNFVKELTWQPSPSIRASSTIENGTDKPPKLPAKPSKQLCEATFPYKAQNEDELSFQEGDIITLINKECGDPGWWLGELNGKTGVFPDNFVVLSSDSNRSSSKSAIKSVSVATQRKSLEVKENIKPIVPIQTKPVKKSPSGGFLSEIKKKIEDVVDGAISSKIDDSHKSNEFDQVDRRPLLTDVRATRVKAPGRRPPTANITPNIINTNNNNINNSIKELESEVVKEEEVVEIKPKLREWEKHKAPWLEEMKLNQVKRTTRHSALEETSNSNDVETVVKTEITKSPVDVEPHPQKHSPLSVIKDIPANPTPVVPEPKRESFAYVLNKLDILEELVLKQKQTIEELQHKLQTETDMRLLMQEKFKNLLH